MATIGQPLTAPEAGWKRYDDNDKNIMYSGEWSIGKYQGTDNSSDHYTKALGDYACFNFTGTKLMVIGLHYLDRSNSIEVYVDGVVCGKFTQYSEGMIAQALSYEVSGLNDIEHCVKIVNNTSNTLSIFTLDAIDIDENGELKPYNPTPSESDKALLRITMNDSSEREYKVSKAIADDFVTWCNRTIGTGNSCYVFDKGIQNSKEYLFYEKIISFEVIPVA